MNRKERVQFLRRAHPDWTQAKIAETVRVSESFVSWALAPPDKAERRRVYDNTYGRARRAGLDNPSLVARAAVEALEAERAAYERHLEEQLEHERLLEQEEYERQFGEDS